MNISDQSSGEEALAVNPYLYPEGDRPAGAQIQILSLDAAYRKREIQLRRIRKAAERGDSRRVRIFVDRFLRSHAAKVVAVNQATKGARRPTAEECNELARQLDVSVAPKEPLIYDPQPKPDGGTRHIYKFRRHTKALQYLVADALCAAIVVPDFHFKAKRLPFDPVRRGTTRAIQHILELVSRTPSEPAIYEYAVLVDVKNFYDSTDRARLVDLLPLPEAVIRNVVLCEGQQVRLSPTRRRPRGYLRRGRSTPRGSLIYSGRSHNASGVPQGSVVSDIVMTMLVADMAQKLPPWAPAFLHGDDVCVLATSFMEAHTIALSMREYFSHHPAGPYALRRCDIARVEVGFDFLGYDITADNDGARVGLATKSRRNLRFWLVDELITAYGQGEYLVPEPLALALRKRLSGYPLLDHQDQHFQWLLGMAQGALDAAIEADRFDLDGPQSIRQHLSSLECCQPVFA